MTSIGDRQTVARESLLAGILCSVIVICVLLAVVNPQPAGVFWDDGVYLTTARTLATGDGYHPLPPPP